jgi:beta-galactosidase
MFREITELGALLPRLAELDGSTVEAEVALLWDAESWWAMQATHLPSEELDYLRTVEAAHRQFWRAGVTVDLPDPAADLTAYKLVVVPSLYLVSDAAAASIARYVEGGGHLLVGYFSGIVDSDARIRLGRYPGAFAELLGVRVEEFHPLPADGFVQLSSGGRGRLWSEDLRATAAEVIDRYAGGVLDGRPAITRREVGAGSAWYVSTELEDAAYAALVGRLTDAAGVARTDLPGVEVVRRHAGGTTWTILLNHSATEAVVPVDGVELISGEEIRGSLLLQAGAQAVVRSS